jgi:hypothetical protein
MTDCGHTAALDTRSVEHAHCRCGMQGTLRRSDPDPKMLHGTAGVPCLTPARVGWVSAVTVVTGLTEI